MVSRGHTEKVAVAPDETPPTADVRSSADPVVRYLDGIGLTVEIRLGSPRGGRQSFLHIDISVDAANIANLDIHEKLGDQPSLHARNAGRRLPRVKRGPDHPLNYLAACERCNTKRQETDLSTAQWERARLLWSSLDVGDMEERSRGADDFYGDITLAGIRCRVHDWHLQGSPAHLGCHRQNLAFMRPTPIYPDLDEWSAVFGRESQEVFLNLMASRLWNEPIQRHALRLTIPRVVSGRLDLLDDLLATCTYEHEVQATDGERLDIFPYARLPLADSVAGRRATARLEQQRRSVNATFRESLGLSGWSALIKLFSERHWPTYIVADHVRYLSSLRSNQKTALMQQIRSMESHREVDELLADLQHDYLARMRSDRCGG